MPSLAEVALLIFTEIENTSVDIVICRDQPAHLMKYVPITLIDFTRIGGEGFAQLVVAACNAPEVFDLIEEALVKVAIAVEVLL
jgi:hypothetical protein